MTSRTIVLAADRPVPPIYGLDIETDTTCDGHRHDPRDPWVEPVAGRVGLDVEAVDRRDGPIRGEDDGPGGHETTLPRGSDSEGDRTDGRVG